MRSVEDPNPVPLDPNTVTLDTKPVPLDPNPVPLDPQHLPESGSKWYFRLKSTHFLPMRYL